MQKTNYDISKENKAKKRVALASLCIVKHASEP